MTFSVYQKDLFTCDWLPLERGKNCFVLPVHEHMTAWLIEKVGLGQHFEMAMGNCPSSHLTSDPTFLELEKIISNLESKRNSSNIKL